MSLLATWRGIGGTFEGRKMVFEMKRLECFSSVAVFVGVEVNMNVVLGGSS